MFTKAKLFHAAGEGSGGDSHDLGWYANESALTTAHATANDGDFAFVGTTDTVWTWDSDTTAWVDTGAAGIELPDQTGNSGKFLTTNGTTASWSDKPLVNQATGESCLSVLGGTTTGYRNTNIGANSKSRGSDNTALGAQSEAYGDGSIAIGYIAKVSDVGTYGTGIAIGRVATVSATGAIQLSTRPNSTTNSDANTFKVANQNGNFEIMSADGTIPTARLTNAINKYSSMPTAGADYLGQIAQFTGTTDANYTHGYIYECVSDGQEPATYSWTAVSVQAGGSSYTAGTGIDITSGVISVTSPTLQNNASGYHRLAIGPSATATNDKTMAIGASATASASESIAIGELSSAKQTSEISIGAGANSGSGTHGQFSVAVGKNAKTIGSDYGIAIGCSAKSTAVGAIQIGDGTNNEAGTFSVGIVSSSSPWTQATYKLLDSDGTIPADRLASTTGLADGNYKLRLTMSNGTPTLTWVAE